MVGEKRRVEPREVPGIDKTPLTIYSELITMTGSTTRDRGNCRGRSLTGIEEIPGM